jgi:HPt (histidine-containing phosphotransfer) domain-containing protein
MWNKNMEEQAIIDLATYNQLKDLMGGDFLVELIDTYITETAALVEQLSQALAGGEAVAFERIAHSIKSSSASLGALSLSQQARELEMMGKANELSGASEKLEQMVANFQQVKRSLEELRDEP